MAVDTQRALVQAVIPIALPEPANGTAASTNKLAFLDAYIAITVDEVMTGPSVLDATATQAYRDVMSTPTTTDQPPALPLDAF